MTTLARRAPRSTVSFWCTTLVLLLTAASASAQFRPRIVSEPTIGDRYHIEGGVDVWFPTAELLVASAGSGSLAGVPGTEIDAKKDFGLVDKKFPQFNLVVRGGPHKLRVQYVPIKYTQEAILARVVDFNGQRYTVGLPVNSTLDWKALRIGYEYDFVVKTRGFVGFIIEDKQTDVRVDVATPLVSPQFAHAQAPIPALGGIGRFWILPRVNATLEITGFKIPDSIDNRYAAHYVDVDVYGTINATKNVGARIGYRSIDLGYVFKQDSGSMTMKGIYFGVVARY